MKIISKRLLVVLIIFGLVIVGYAKTPTFEVLAGTSLIADIVKGVGGDKVQVRTIIPPGSCPGHYDVKPKDIKTLAEGKIFIIHHWQQHQENIKRLIETANNPNLVIKVIEVVGNWMTPPVQAEAVTAIADVLVEIDKNNSAYYSKKAKERRQAILAKEEEIRSKLEKAKVRGIKVVCAEMQVGFIKWAGFEIVATYGRPEELTPEKVAEVIAKAKVAGVVLVIDNLQSGPDAGKQIARDIGAIQVTLSNFPGGFKRTNTWERALDKNVDLLLDALVKYRKTIVNE